MTCHNDSAPQGGPYRVLTIIRHVSKLSDARSEPLSMHPDVAGSGARRLPCEASYNNKEINTSYRSSFPKDRK